MTALSLKLRNPREKPVPGKEELPSTFADRIGVYYASKASSEHKKQRGQFFTPTAIAHLMASMCNCSGYQIRILDPGCGTGVLSCAAIEHLVAKSKQLKRIELVLYETDKKLIAYAEEVMSYLKKWLAKKNIRLKFTVNVKDFVLGNSTALDESFNLFGDAAKPFDIVISNPPYFKLSKDDKRAKAASIVVSGQPNIYSIFMAVAARLVRIGGEVIFITPRSFTSGNYFKAFREYFFRFIQLERIHLFVSRKDTFNRDKVLQELVIIKGIRCTAIDNSKQVTVTSSHGLKDITRPASMRFQSLELIDFKTREKIIHLPISSSEEEVLNLVKRWKGTLNQFNIQISTGPVVAFRSRDFIRDHYENGAVFLAPLFWLHNVNKMKLDWPILRPNKGQYIRILESSKSILIPNKDYVFLRRFSSKDDKSRLIASPYFSCSTNAEYIGVENKLNYIYRPNGLLERSEVVGLCALLNSDLFDTYFRIFNGNVNVSATELREMTFPTLAELKEIGNRIILANDYSNTYLNSLINEHFSVQAISKGND